ncbi:uncharacterized protein METZ01_LOCUS101039, partial [marine metagenome]
VAGTLLLFWDCAGRIKPWKFRDTYALDVRILNTQQWSKTVSRDLIDLDKIMVNELRYYLDNDLRIYERLELNYNLLQSSITDADSLTQELIHIVQSMKELSSAGLDSIANDTSVTYRKIIRSKSNEIQKVQGKYYKSREALNKGFRKVRKKLVFVKEESEPLKETLYKIKYRRDALQPYIEHFNSVLNQSLFENPESLYSKRITKLSKKFESYRVTMDEYEEFIYNINDIAREEAGGYVMLTSRKGKPMDYIIRYEEGLDEYYIILDDIRKIS